MTIDLDLGAARHCARLAASCYGHANVEMPQRLKDHLDYLSALGSRHGTEYEGGQQESNNDFIDADQAARTLGCSSRYVRRIAADLDGRKIAGRWIFDKKLVDQYGTAKAGGRQRG